MGGVEEYSKISGYKINKSKCEALTIGMKMNQSLKQHYNIKLELLNILVFISVRNRVIYKQLQHRIEDKSGLKQVEINS